MENQFQKCWGPIASIVGAVLLAFQLAQAFTGNRTLVTGLLIFFSLIAIGVGMWKFAFEHSPIPDFQTYRYRFHWLAKIIVGVDLVSILISAIYILTLLEVVPVCCKPVATKTPTVFTRQVFSMKYPFDSTNIHVEKGNRVEITVTGKDTNWNCGRSITTNADGFSSETYADTVYTQANACALIGSISSLSPEVYFLVGSHVTFIAEESGTLYLGCNDSVERFADNPSDSKLDVEITIGN